MLKIVKTCRRGWTDGVSVGGTRAVRTSGKRRGRRVIEKMPAGQPASSEQSAATTTADGHSKAHTHDLFCVIQETAFR